MRLESHLVQLVVPSRGMEGVAMPCLSGSCRCVFENVTM